MHEIIIIIMGANFNNNNIILSYNNFKELVYTHLKHIL